MPRLDTDPVQILNRDKQSAARLVEGVGKAHTFALLKRAQDQLNRRLKQAEGLCGAGKGSYTANQLRQTLQQVRAVTTGLKVGMKDLTTAQGLHLANQAAKTAVDYLRASEHKFKGSTRELSLDSARMMDRSVAGAKSSILRRLMSDPRHPAHKGILDRYGDAVVTHFEDTLQTAVVARTPWHEVRDQLIEGSPFLQQAPASWAERIVRTETMNAHGVASHTAIVDAQQQLGDMVKIISSVFDSRTGSDSFSVHGQIRRPSESFDSWFGPYMHPPDRPNDRSVVVPHRIGWPIPANLKAKDGGSISARWTAEGRKGSPPPQPNVSTVPLEQFGKPPVRDAEPPPPEPVEPPLPKPAPKLPRQSPMRLTEPESVPPPGRSSPIARQLGEFERAVMSFHGPTARGLLRDEIANAFPSSVSRDMAHGLDGAATIRPFTELERDQYIGALAFHDWSGAVGVHSETLESLKGLSDALSKGLAAQTQTYVRGDETRHVLNYQLTAHLDSLNTLVHEEIHGHSRTSGQSYRGAAAMLEEVGTELNARHVIRTLTPEFEAHPAIQKKFGNRGGAVYSKAIEHVGQVVSEAAGVDVDTAIETVRTTHVHAIMGKGPSFQSPDEHVDAFVDALPYSPGIKRTIAEKLRETKAIPE